VLLSLIVICYNDDVEDCTGFETQVIAGCQALGSGSDICIFLDNKCIPSYSYTECSQYKPETGFNDKICELITPSDGTKKCVVVPDNDGKKKCEEQDKECADHNIRDNCKDLKAGGDKRCVLVANDKCEAHYDDCTKANQATCNSNIPKNTSKKCKWTTSCTETDRLCEDYIDYDDKYINSNDNSIKGCFYLKAETDKVCIDLTKEGCKQYYASCDKANGKEDLCGTFKPVNNGKTGFISDYYCSYSGSTCEKTKKKCKNFVKGEDDASICPSLDASNDNKMCHYDSEKNECQEIYITCDSYNSVKTVASERSSSECAAITYRDSSTKAEDPHYECYLNNENTCTKRKKECDLIKDSGTCNSHVLDDQNKKCLFTGSKCKEIYKTCEKYEANVKENKNKEDCEIIEPFIESGKKYKCVFGQDSVCTKKELKCEDYQGQDALECKTYSINLDADHQCALIGGKCIEQFNACENYKETNKTICESITLYDLPNYKCILEHDKECKKEQKLCSEYLGDSETECVKDYKASVDTKKCVLENHKCVEKSIFNYCSDYRGTNKEDCESIKPFFTDVNSVEVDPSSKCVYTNEGCIKKTKGCGEATTESECLLIIPEDTNKQCVYIGNSCIEQYKTCQLYYEKENTIDKTICESILIKETGYSSAEYRCEYTAPATGQTKGTCTRKKRSCSDFEPKLIQSQCGSISLTDKTKKCVFDNNSCSPLYKTCSELSNLSGATDDLCKNGVTSSADKSCVAKSDKSGCEEKEKEKDEKPEETTAENPESQPNEAEPTDGNSFSSKNYLSILTFIAVCLVF